ncbi:protein MANNAN SYNTHESIS-RELATED 1-like [Aristolochia californica]|uniref:protein MANNAN SYNTHESIS-RELATED 1-like n=1 Tax=Aristolochia californica TaxID=171875 RepID=UPI0035D64A39
MAVDPKHALGAFLTFTMFAMLANMIKKDHFDPVDAQLPQVSTVQFEVMKIEEHKVSTGHKVSKGPWNKVSEELKPCWKRPGARLAEEAKEPRGYVTFSLTNGPEYHIAQVADAVVVAKYLGATLVVPDIRGSKLGDKRNFADIYDIEKFEKSLDGVVKIAKDQPAEVATGKLAVVKIPNRLTEDYIAEHIEPQFRTKGNIRLVTFFPSVNMKIRETEKEADSVTCLAMFGTLELQKEITETVDSMLARLRTLSRRSDGQFVAVDLRVDILQGKGCKDSGQKGKSCYSPEEIAVFLQKIGFDRETTIYVTQPRWHESLEALKNKFPKTYTKESIVPANKKGQFLNSESPHLEKVLDFHICSQSDVFVPAISGLFYANVAGKRIASGTGSILVPSEIRGSSAPATNFVSPYLSKKNHMAYSCFCDN